MARWLRRPWDGLFAECIGVDELTVVLTRGGRLAALDRTALTLSLDADLLSLAEQDPAGRSLLRLATRHEWRHACGGALYGPVLSAEGMASRRGHKVTRAWVPASDTRGLSGGPVAAPGGPREEFLVLIDDLIEFAELDPDSREGVLGALDRIVGADDGYAALLGSANRRRGIDETLMDAAADLAAGKGTSAASQLRAEAPSLMSRYLENDALLTDPRLYAPEPGAAGRLLRGANDNLRLPPYVQLSALPGPDVATSRNLLVAAVTELRALPGIRSRRRRALRRLAFLAAAEAAARHANQPVVRAGEAPALVAVAQQLLRGAGHQAAAVQRVVTTDLADCVLERAEAALDEGASRRALDDVETVLEFIDRRSSGADAVWVEALRNLRQRARAGLERAAEDEQAAVARREHRKILAVRGAECARDPEALVALLKDTVAGRDAMPEDVLAVLTAVDREWDGQLGDTDVFQDVETLARQPGASSALVEGVRRMHGLMALAEGRAIDVGELSLESTCEALASERLFQSVFGIEDVRARAALEHRVLDLLDGVGPTQQALFRRKGLLRRERLPVAPAEALATVSARVRDLQKRWMTQRDPAVRDELIFAEWCHGLWAVVRGEPAEAWEHLSASCNLLGETGAGEQESVLATVAATPQRGTFGDANRLLRALAPVRHRMSIAMDLCAAIAAAPEGLTAAQREKASATLDRWRAARQRFPRVVEVRVEGADREARLVEFLEVGRGGKEGQFAALRHLFLGRSFYPFLGYHVLELDGGGGRTERYVAKVGINDSIAQAYSGAFRLLIKDAAAEVARLRGNHQRELFVNRWLRAYSEDLRERARVAGRAESRARHAGDQMGAQEARRTADAERVIGEALLVPDVRVAEVGDALDPVPLLCCEVVSDLQEFPKSRFSREADHLGTLRRLRRQEERIAAALAVLHEQAKDSLRGGRGQVAADLLDHEASERVRRVRGHAACLALLFANTDFQLFSNGARMACIDMGELIMPEVFAVGADDVARDQTHRIDCAVVTEQDRVEDFLDVADSYSRFIESNPEAITEAAREADLPPEVVKRVAGSLAARAAMLPEALTLLIKSGGTLYVGGGGRFLPRERGSGTRYVRRGPRTSQATIKMEAPSASDLKAPPSEATITLDPAAAAAEPAPTPAPPPPPRPKPAPPKPAEPAGTAPSAPVPAPAAGGGGVRNPYAFAPEGDATVHLDPSGAREDAPPAEAPAPEPSPADPYAFADEGEATVYVNPSAARLQQPAGPPADAAADPDDEGPVPTRDTEELPAPEHSPTVLIAIAHPGRQAFVENACKLQGFSVELADDTMVAAARVRAGGIDVLIVDADLPEVGGGEVLRVTQSSAPDPVHTIFLATAEALQDPMLAELQPDAILRRPLHADELRSRLDAARAATS